jgi:hypothetical protein
MNHEFVKMVLEEVCSFLQGSFLQALLSVDDLKFRIASVGLAMIQAIYRHVIFDPFNWSQFLNGMTSLTSVLLIYMNNMLLIIWITTITL